MKNTTRQKWNDFVMKSKFLTNCYVSYMHYFVKKMKDSNDKISLKHYGIKDMFTWVAIETTDICTRRCEYCPLKNAPRHNYLDSEIVYRVLDDLKARDYIGKICFSNYGEPVLDNRLPDFVKKAREYFPHTLINMSTNGDVLTPEKFRELVEAGMNEFDITQHGPVEPANHKRLKEELNAEEKKLIIWIKIDDDSLLSNRGGNVEVKSKRIPKKICYQSTLIVRADETVTLCCHDYFGEITLGNLREENIYDIWFNPDNVKLRDDLYHGVANRNICKKCYLFNEK